MNMAIRCKLPMEEPRSLATFERDVGIKEIDESLRMHFSYSFNPLKAVDYLYRNILHESYGDHIRLYFPLTAMQSLGEFIRGAIGVIKAQAEVSMLATPVHDHQTEAYTLDDNVRKSLRDTDRELIIVDHTETGVTFDKIKNSIYKVCAERQVKMPSVKLVDPSELSVGKNFEFSSTYEKDKEGELVLARGETLEFFLQNPKADPKRFRNGAKNFQETLIIANKEYFTEQESARLMPQVEKVWGRGEYDLHDVIVSFIISLPAIRQRQIVAELNNRDALFLKAVYFYGVAAAKDYQRDRA